MYGIIPDSKPHVDDNWDDEGYKISYNSEEPEGKEVVGLFNKVPEFKRPHG